MSIESEEIKNYELLKSLRKFEHVKIAEISNTRNSYYDKVCKYIKNNKINPGCKKIKIMMFMAS